MSSTATTGLIPVHIGREAPTPPPYAPVVLGAAVYAHGPTPGARRHRQQAPGVEVDWAALGVDPRWVGRESVDCAAAVQPSQFTNSGRGDLDRFLSGAERRGETALVVVSIGDADAEPTRSVFGADSASAWLPGRRCFVRGVRLPDGARPRLAEDLEPGDRDLGLRILNSRSDGPWWTLAVGTYTSGSPGRQRSPQPSEGSLHPVLVDDLGEAVVAVWIPNDQDVRWYVVPDATDWAVVTRWLVERALPEYAPGALRRLRALGVRDTELETLAETAARVALEDLERTYAEEKLRLETDLAAARDLADPVREGLLYGTGTSLEDAVQAVLVDAGYIVTRLDDALGTESADLLVELDGRSWLVEVKSASGMPQEALVDKLLKHLNTWPGLNPGTPLDGGVLVVNHQLKLAPGDRAAQVYQRRAFVESLQVPVVGTTALFDAWRAANWPAVHALVSGEATPV